MKRQLSMLLALTMCAAVAMSGCGSSGATTSSSTPAAPATSGDAAAPAPAESTDASAWNPTDNINWVVTSSPGGGSDIYTRNISDIMTKEGVCTQTFLVTNKTDGGGEVGRNEVANTKKGKQADHTILTFNSGDLMPMLKNTPNRLENFTPIAIMAVDKQLIFKGEQSKYADFKEAIEAAKGGTQIVIGGSKGDDVATYEKMMETLGMTDGKEMSYVTFDATSDAITQILGGHIDFVISKPAAASEYVEAKKLVPVLALSNERYGGNLADAPTLSEIGDYPNVEVPVWRGVVGPKNMSPEAAAFWSGALKKVSESEAWKTNYIDKNKLISQYMSLEETNAFMSQFQKDYMESNGIK